MAEVHPEHMVMGPKEEEEEHGIVLGSGKKKQVSVMNQICCVPNCILHTEMLYRPTRVSQ